MRAATRLFDLGKYKRPRQAQAGESVQHRLGATCRPLKLMSPSLRQLPQLRAVEDDILENKDYPQRFHVLRAANILNLAYFDAASPAKDILRNLRSRLQPGGLLIICTHGRCGRVQQRYGVHPWKKTGGLRPPPVSMKSSEIADLVLGLPRR